MIDHGEIAAKIARRAMHKKMQRAMNSVEKLKPLLEDWQYKTLTNIKARFNRPDATPEPLTEGAMITLQWYVDNFERLENQLASA